MCFLADREGRRIIAVLPTDRNPEQMDLYRAELSGILAGILVIHVLQILYGYKRLDNFTGTLWTDSESSLKQIEANTSLTPFSNKAANCSEYPLLQEIRYIRSLIPTGLQIKWVKSHQKKPTKREAKMNKEVDKLADEHYDAGDNWRSRKTM